ncbi:MAG: hypothetical protein U0529_03490 [Thermoanaerobaculia bacterium]
MAGMLVISMLVELLEFALVSAVNGRVTIDPGAYYAIRNRLWFLGLKLTYNTLAAGFGGFLAALIAGHAFRAHGIALAVIQALAFGWALTRPELSRNIPSWMWASLSCCLPSGPCGDRVFRSGVTLGPIRRTPPVRREHGPPSVVPRLRARGASHP